MASKYICISKSFDPAMAEFGDQTKKLVGALGWDLFGEVRGRPNEPVLTAPEASSLQQPSSLVFVFRGDGYAATMMLSPSGDFVVLAGSKARIRTTATIPRGTVSLRKTLMDAGVIREGDGFLVFDNDYSFSSVSAAAATVIGAASNGRILWKLPDGRTYGEWESDQDDGPNGQGHSGEGA